MEVAAELSVSKTQVLNISRCRATLHKRQLTSKAANFGQFADIDKAVFDWFCRVRTPVGLPKPLPISLAALQARAQGYYIILSSAITNYVGNKK